MAVQSFFAAGTSAHTIPLLPSWSAITVTGGRVAVIDDCPTRGEGGGDPLLGHLGRHIDLDVEPLTWGLVLVGVPEPQVRHPSRGVPDLVAGGPVALGLGDPFAHQHVHRRDPYP